LRAQIVRKYLKIYISSLLTIYFLAAEAQVHNVINKLYTTTQAAMQLHANLKNTLLLKELENALIMSRNMLSSITNR